MDDKEVFNPQSGERIAPKKPKKFWKDWRFYVYTIIAVMLAIVSVSSMVTACAAINAGVGQSEPVSSEYKVKRNASGTTDGGYTYYRMEVPLRWYMANNNGCYYQTYDVDINTYDLTALTGANYTGSISNLNSSTSISQAILDKISYVRPTETNSVRFLAMFGKSDIFAQGTQRKWAYFSFCLRNGDTMGILPKSFVMTTPWKGSGIKVSTSGISYAWYSAVDQNYYTLTYEESVVYLYDIGLHMADWEDTYLYFQDVVSYYSQQGYESGHTSGYSEGHTSGYAEGYESGHTSGYSEGHTSGYAEGYEDGETHAYDTLKTGIAFETYGMYGDAKITLVADRTEGSYYYMDLFDYVTDTNIERSVYVLYIQNASNSTWLGYVQDVNVSDSSGATYDIGSFTGASSTTDVVFTALMDRNLWEGAYITSFHGHAEAVNNAFWFTGGSYAATQQVYQDGYGEGYDAGRTDGYGVGYDAGVQVGRTQGLNEAEPESLTNTLVAVFQQPFNQIYRFFNFNVLGLNVLGIVSGLVSVLVVLKVFKKLYK